MSVINRLKVIGVVVLGLILSIVLHEAFHVLMHWDHIISIDILPKNGNIIQVVARTPVGYNQFLEELVAYLISASTVFIAFEIADRINEHYKQIAR